MNYIKLFIIILLQLAVFYSFAQNTVSSKENVGSILDHTNPVPTINGKDLPPPNLVGSPYLLEGFNEISFFYKGKIYNYPSNLDLLSYTLDINYKGDTVFVSLQEIDSVHVSYLGDSATVFSEGQINIDDSEKKYIYIKLVSGKYNLYLRKVAILKEPDFDPKFAVGSKDYEIVVRDKFLLQNDSVFEEKNKFLFQNKDFFKSDYSKLKKIVKTDDLDYNDTSDLINIIEKLNSSINEK